MTSAIDPDWSSLKAPSLDEMEVMAHAVFERLPQAFRKLCEGLVIRVDDFATDEVLDRWASRANSTCSAFFRGSACRSRATAIRSPMPNMVWLYRRPILDYWAEHDETIGHIVRHVLIHEIGHHFGLSDDDMERIEEQAERAWTLGNARIFGLSPSGQPCARRGRAGFPARRWRDKHAYTNERPPCTSSPR